MLTSLASGAVARPLYFRIPSAQSHVPGSPLVAHLLEMESGLSIPKDRSASLSAIFLVYGASLFVVDETHCPYWIADSVVTSLRPLLSALRPLDIVCRFTLTCEGLHERTRSQQKRIGAHDTRDSWNKRQRVNRLAQELGHSSSFTISRRKAVLSPHPSHIWCHPRCNINTTYFRLFHVCIANWPCSILHTTKPSPTHQTQSPRKRSYLSLLTLDCCQSLLHPPAH